MNSFHHTRFQQRYAFQNRKGRRYYWKWPMPQRLMRNLSLLNASGFLFGHLELPRWGIRQPLKRSEPGKEENVSGSNRASGPVEEYVKIAFPTSLSRTDCSSRKEGRHGPVHPLPIQKTCRYREISDSNVHIFLSSSVATITPRNSPFFSWSGVGTVSEILSSEVSDEACQNPCATTFRSIPLVHGNLGARTDPDSLFPQNSSRFHSKIIFTSTP
jgi:hypothetical protein